LYDTYVFIFKLSMRELIGMHQGHWASSTPIK